jgi:hypothetical protein
MKKTEYKQASLTGVNALATGPAKVVRTYTPGGCQAQQELDAQAAKQGDASQLQRSGYSSKDYVGCFFEGTATTKCGHCYDCREHYR